MMMMRLSESGLSDFLRDEVDPYLRDRVDARFAGEGDDAVGQWLPLATATENIRAAYGYAPDHPINERTGEMHEFLVNNPGQVTGLGQGAALEFPGSIDGEIATKIMTAQLGRDFPPTQPRPVVALSNIDEEDVLNDLADYILRDSYTIAGVLRI